MCGIWALINQSNELHEYLNIFWNIKHRGPDNSCLQSIDNVYYGFHRLAIMDISSTSNQPYVLNYDNKTIVFICNGEIYNYKELDEKYKLNIGSSDCLSIPKLYMKMKNNWLELFKTEIKGEFAFMLFEFKNNKLDKYFIGRDMVGIRPLYVNQENNLYSSEIKGMLGTICEYPPGIIREINSIDIKDFDFTTIYNHKFLDQTDEDILTSIRTSVYNSIERRLSSDRPMAFLLSGGVDSSLVAAISSKLLGKQINTFCCGMKGSTDMKYARLVAEHIGSNHTEVYFTEEEGLEVIDDVIKTVESWDTTTIRASVGQYIVSRYVARDYKVLLVGEGPDEVCSSYLFNYYAPNSSALHNTAEEYVKKIHMFDGKRADRCIARWGMEARIPLLDPEFINSYWDIRPELRDPKNNIEKYLLRKAFEELNLLPTQVLWRKKEAFSDGVSGTEKSWYKVIQDYVETKVTVVDNIAYVDDMIMEINDLTLEAVYYKMLFRKHFGNNRYNIIPHYWQPKWDKDGDVTTYVDPSARTLAVYDLRDTCVL
jgi:asparagine synthase (glutamine-hydrolysing)